MCYKLFVYRHIADCSCCIEGKAVRELAQKIFLRSALVHSVLLEAENTLYHVDDHCKEHGKQLTEHGTVTR